MSYAPDGYPLEPQLPPPYGAPAYGPAPTTAPAVGMVVVAVLNLLFGSYLMLNGLVSTRMSDEQIETIMEQQQPENIDQLRQAGFDGPWLRRFMQYLGFGGGGLHVFLAMLTLLGGMRMLFLRSYGLAVFCAAVMAIPCVSPAACCLMGEAVGIWALIVLLNPNVRALFR